MPRCHVFLWQIFDLEKVLLLSWWWVGWSIWDNFSCFAGNFCGAEKDSQAASRSKWSWIIVYHKGNPGYLQKKIGKNRKQILAPTNRYRFWNSSPRTFEEISPLNPSTWRTKYLHPSCPPHAFGSTCSTNFSKDSDATGEQGSQGSFQVTWGDFCWLWTSSTGCFKDWLASFCSKTWGWIR